MPTTISGTTGVSQVQDGVVSTQKLVDSAVTPAKTQAGALPSMVRVNTANGYGSTNTRIRRFTNTVLLQGADITYVDSATLGASFTVNASGVYSVSYSECFSASNDFGVTLNTTQPTTSISSTPIAEQFFCISAPFANYGVSGS